MAKKETVLAGNDLFDRLKDDLNAALAREVQVRTNYEQSLIPQLERDLQASRSEVVRLTKEVADLSIYKERSERAWEMIEESHALVTRAIDSAPGTAPVV